MISLNSIFFEFEMNMGVNERIERLDLMEKYVLKGGADGCGKNTCVNKDSAPPSMLIHVISSVIVMDFLPFVPRWAGSVVVTKMIVCYIFVLV